MDIEPWHIIYQSCAGMLSKSMGQILRVSAALHVLFDTEGDKENPITMDEKTTVSALAIEAAIDFVEVCCQQTAHIAGRGNIGNIGEELDLLETGDFNFVPWSSNIAYHNIIL